MTSAEKGLSVPGEWRTSTPGEFPPLSARFWRMEENILHTSESDRVRRSRGSSVKDAMTYDTTILRDWSVLFNTGCSVWRKPSLWRTVLKLLLVSFLVMLFCLAMYDDATKIEQARLVGITKIFNFCICMLLGFYLSSSVNRWWSVYDGFERLAHELSDLQMDMSCFGVPQDRSWAVLRLGVLSAWVLLLQLREAMAPRLDQGEQYDLHTELIRFSTSEGHDSICLPLDSHEICMLLKVEDPAGALWTWFGSLLGRLSEDGWVPPMTTPAFGNLLANCSGAVSSVRQIKRDALCQAPYIYVQMLASIVHLNNIMCAFSFGVSLAATVAQKIKHRRFEQISAATSTLMCEDLFIGMCMGIFGPLIYQALFEVAISMSQPFADEGARLPASSILRKLERSIGDASRASQLVDWEAPKFKKDAAPPGPDPAAHPSPFAEVRPGRDRAPATEDPKNASIRSRSSPG